MKPILHDIAGALWYKSFELQIDAQPDNGDECVGNSDQAFWKKPDALGWVGEAVSARIGRVPTKECFSFFRKLPGAANQTRCSKGGWHALEHISEPSGTSESQGVDTLYPPRSQARIRRFGGVPSMQF